MARRKSKKSPETEAASPRDALTRPTPDALGSASPAASSEAAAESTASGEAAGEAEASSEAGAEGEQDAASAQ